MSNNELLATKLREALEAGLGDEAVKAIKKQVRDLTDDIDVQLEWHFKDVLTPALVGFVEDMAKRTVEQLLEGNEEQMRRYLGCDRNGWTGRSDSPNVGRARDISEWHSVIHGKLFEQGFVAVRKAIVEAHRDLITNERILDLEDQVKALVAQVNKANAEKEKMFERVRELS